MKITFIRTNMFERISSDAMKPILFSIIRDCTPKEHDIDFLDERTEKLPEKIDADIIAFSVETYTAKRAYILARKYKTDKNIIAMGGFHASAVPDEILEYADTALVGDAEDTWGRFLADCAAGAPKQKYISDEKLPLQKINDHPGIYKKSYFKVGIHQLSRGCKFSCGFCSIKTLYRCVRRKHEDIVYDELKAAKEKIIFFADDNLFYDRDSAISLFQKIAPLGKKWACQISMDAARDDALLSEMKKAGCFLVLIGFESLNQNSILEMNKKANAAFDYEEILGRLRRHGIMVYAMFVLGCDGDGPDVFEKTLEFSVKNKIALTNFNPLSPMPGTEVYRRMEREGRLIYRKWWLSDRYRYGEATFVPKNMSPDELKDGCLDMRKRFYSFGCILKRLFASPMNFIPLNFFVFIMANLVSRSEILKKQGQLLGGILNETDVD